MKLDAQIRPDTIVAVSTPPGRGGIGIVRLSGPDAVAMTRQLVAPVLMEQAHARLTQVLDARDGAAVVQVVDEAMVTAFFAPHSYTGEDVVEIAAHGSPVVLSMLVDRALALGARLAEAGEFTQRAFLAGKIDLTQAEAVHDLIAAQTIDQARVAAQQLGGAMSRRVAPAKDQLLHLIALLEAGMDFASGELDDVDVVPPQQIAEEIALTREPLVALAASFRHGALLRDGAALALVGLPNAGKSSLFNRLLERERAIVTPVAGTTRDTVEESIALGGVPVRLIDTAGLRGEDAAAVDEAERQGMARSREALADADLVVFVHDATRDFSDEERALLESVCARPCVVVANKVDLVAAERKQDSSAALRVSALTGEGVAELRASILRELHAEGAVADAGALNTVRQREAVAATVAALDAAAAANENGLPHELLLVDLHNALRALDSLTGATTTDDILGLIFSTFCIGK